MQTTSAMGLDLGTKTGWAFQRRTIGVGTALAFGEWDFKVDKYNSPSLRYTKFKSELKAMLTLGVDIVFFELVRRHQGTQAAHVYGAFVAAMQEVCDQAGVPYKGVGVSQVKKFATGKGNAPKEEMVKACQRWGYAPGGEDAADAICILKYGVERGADA